MLDVAMAASYVIPNKTFFFSDCRIVCYTHRKSVLVHVRDVRRNGPRYSNRIIALHVKGGGQRKHVAKFYRQHRFLCSFKCSSASLSKLGSPSVE